MSKRHAPRANAVRGDLSPRDAAFLNLSQEEFDRLDCVTRADAIAAQWKAQGRWPGFEPDSLAPEAKPRALKVTKADVRRAAEAARAIGFDFDELEVGGVVMRRRAASIPAVVHSDDVEAELAAYEASRARR